MVRMRRTVTPSARSSRVRNGELVSTTFPERISLPMMMMPAVRSTDVSYTEIASLRKSLVPMRTLTSAGLPAPSARSSAGRMGSGRAERARVEPVAEAARAEHVGRGADEVAAVADHDGVGREQPVHLGAQAERVDGRRVGGELGRERRPLLLLEPAQLAEPAARQLGLPAGRARAFGERLHGQPGVADDADVAATVLAELAAVEVDVDQLGGLVDVRAAPVADAEVERGAEDEDHVGALERVLARLQEPVRVLGVERAARLPFT